MTILSKLASVIWWLLLSVLVLAALYAGLGRQLTQNINDYRPQFEQQLSERLGLDVRIGALSSRWNWLNPTIVARDLVIKPDAASDEAIASLQSLRVGLDFLASVARRRIVFSDFDADGLVMVINQSPRGEIAVEGAELPEPVVNDLEQWIDLAGQWLSDPSVRITRIDLGLRDGGGKLRQVEIPQLDLNYRRGLFHASGRAMRPGTTEQLASFELVGQHFFRGDFTGQFYGDINSGRLFDGLAQEYSWQGLRAEGFDLGGQIWLTFRDGLMEQVSGSVQTPYLQLAAGQESLAPIEDLRAEFGWRRHTPGEAGAGQTDAADQTPWYATGAFHLNDLTWRWDGETVPGFDLRFQAGADADRLVADGFPIAPVRGLVSRLGILPEALGRALENYRPSGRLNRLLLELPAGDQGQFRFTAELNDVSVRAHSGAPAAQGLEGSIVVTRQGGLVRANTSSLRFGFPGLFKDLWDVRNFRADVAWQFDDDTTRVYASDIAMDHGTEARLTGAFDLKLAPRGEDVLSLQVGVERGDAGMLAEFVPVHLVDPGLYDWLTRAIASARITEGTYFGHGRIGGQAPRGAFVSSMVYDFQDASVVYDDRWPQVTEASGRVFVHQGQTRVDLATGKTGGIALGSGQVRVEPGDAATMLWIDANGPVTGEALAYWMTESPLGAMTGMAPDSLRVDGEFDLNLGLGFALNSDRAPTVDARVNAKSLSLSYPAADLQWKDLSGELSYNSDSGFSQAPVTAKFLDSPVKAWFRRSRSGDGIVIRQEGNTDLMTLRDRLAPAASTLGTSGQFKYQATLTLVPDKPPAIELLSDLAGMAIDWPEPLGKQASAIAPLTIEVMPGEGPGIGFGVDWQDRLNMEIDWRSGRIDVMVNDLRLGKRRFQDVGIEAVSGANQWLISLSAEWIRGMISWPAETGLMIVDLENLSFVRDGAELDEEAVPLETEDPVRAFRELDSANWPDVDVRIADLKINGEDAGIWSFGLRPETDRLRVVNIDAQLKSLSLTGDLDWGVDTQDVRTGFKGSLEGDSLADIDALMAAEVPFRSDKTAIQLDLNWPGRPDQFAVAELSGSASIRFDDGVILEGNSTAQLFRIFNLLNSDTLWRRLQLDFSDLYEAGVAFDAISGKARLNRGVVTLDPELQIVGPSGAFKFSGTTDMAQETLDMSMVVVLPLTQNLPLAALLMGAGAPIGGALFVLDKVLGDPLSKLTSATYSVRGTWDNPDVNLKRVFDNGK